MMRALYTAATGMRAEQTNVDTIANNLSNVNTTGFKGQRTEFKSLLYQTIQTRSTSGNGDAKPVGAQVGHWYPCGCNHIHLVLRVRSILRRGLLILLWRAMAFLQ